MMIAPQPIGFVNTGLPVLGLVAFAACAPRWFASRDNKDQYRLLAAVVVTSILLLALGAILFAFSYHATGAQVLDAFGAAPMGVALYFLKLSAMAGLIWAPVLALTYLVLAQKVEARKGEDRARGNTR